MKSNYWRNMNYVSQISQKPVIVVAGEKTIVLPKRNNKKFKKFLCEDRETGRKTCAIVFPDGHVCIGDDVWRLSNKADSCEYSYSCYRNRQTAERLYKFISGDTPFCVCWERRDYA